MSLPESKKDRISILFVDDEPFNLSTFKASFREFYTIHLAKSAQEARQILSENLIHIIFADQRMPTTTGIQFFESILEEFPDAIRVLLTGYADVDAVIDAINKGQVYRYIKKPWNELEIKHTIEKGFELYSIRKQLDEKVVLLEKTNHELNRFVYSASHELRAPLMSILGLIKLAKIDKIEPKALTLFDLVEKSVKKLDLFIRNITDYYKNNRVSNHYVTIDFQDIVKDAIDNCIFYHGPDEVTVKTEIDDSGVFYSDAFRIKVIFNNIISNAVKYQRPEEPNKKLDIKIQIFEHSALIVIQDNGIGIMAERINQIFKMFYRATETNTGSGVGLYLVKEATDQLNGSIDVQSTFGVGTKFIITIPNRKE